MNMKSLTASFAISLFLISTLIGIQFGKVTEANEASHASDNYWVDMSPVPAKYTATLGAAEVDGKIYFIGNAVNELYDPKADTWATKTPPLDFPYSVAGVTVCLGKIYVIGGTLGMVYYPSTDKWENMTAAPTQRYFNVVTVDDKIYAISGQLLAGFGIIAASNTSQVYDPATNAWIEIASIPMPVVGYAEAVLDGKIYIIGGSKSGFYRDPLQQSLVQIYDPKTNQWTQGTPLLEPVSGAAAAVTANIAVAKRIYIVGGNIINAGWQVMYSDHVQIYDPESGNWTFGPQMFTGRSYLALVNVGDLLYALGGQNKTVDVTVPANPTQQELQEAYDKIASMQTHANERLTPMGYGTVPLSTVLPTPTPTSISTSAATTPSPSIPEFQTWIMVPLILAATIVILDKSRGRKR